MHLLTVDEMRALERRADAAGLSYARMMRNAGTNAARMILAGLNPVPGRAHKALILVGPGNNGGDGLVCAAELRRSGVEASAYLLKPRSYDDPVYAAARAADVAVTEAQDDVDLIALRRSLDEADVVVDAVLGTGASRPIDGLVRDVLKVVGAWRTSTSSAPRPPIVALDGPTGMNYDTGALDPAAVPADLTITFHAPKRGHYCYPAAGARGELVVAPIGLEDAGLHGEVQCSVVLADLALVQTLLPRRSPDGNKGTHGKALIVAGCADYMGAPTLAARAAYRVGAGLVAYAVPQAVRLAATLACPEATFASLPEAVDVHVPGGVPRIAAWLKGIGAGAVLAVGPGLGQAPETVAFTEALLRELVARTDGRGLLCDADALNILAAWPDWPARLPEQTILTPHPGEMSRLMRSSVSAVQADRIGIAVRCAADWKCVVLLKGAYTVIAAPDGRAAVLPFANPAMAVAGMGDVLSGCIAGLLAQGLPPSDAAVAGGYVHAMAGGAWLQQHGDAGLLASDLFDLLPDALRSVKQAAVA